MFHSEPQTSPKQKHLTIVRVKAGRPITGLVCGAPLRTFTHWYRQKSRPCLMEPEVTCPLCEAGLGKRPYVYYPIQDSKGSVVVVELTAVAEEQIRDQIKCDPDDSWIYLTVSRTGGKRNAPLHCEIDFKSGSSNVKENPIRRLIQPEQIQRSLCILWGLPEWTEGETIEHYEPRVRRFLEQLVAGHAE